MSGERWKASDEEMRRRRLLADLVDTELSRDEQEFDFSGFGDRGTGTFISYVPTMVRSLLKHDFAKINWLYVGRGDERGGRVSDPEEVSTDAEGVRIEGISAEIPVGVLSVKGVPRTDDRKSRVVSTPEKARDAAEAFADGGNDVEEGDE